MIISPQRNFIFIHLHKCGGSSVTEAYQPHMLWNDIVLGTTPIGTAMDSIYRPNFGLHKHVSAANAKAIIGGAFWNTSRRFALIRHPHAIYESLYRWSSQVIKHESNKNPLRVAWWREHVKRDRYPHPFLKWPPIRFNLLSNNFVEFMQHVVTSDVRGPSFTPIVDRLSEAGNLLVSDVYKLEEVERFWLDLSHYLQVDIQPIHRNRGANVPIHWRAEHVDYVNTKHAKDFAAFDYQPRRPD